MRQLRKERDVIQKRLAAEVAIKFTYLGNFEKERLGFAKLPSEELIYKLASAPEGDEDELLILAKKGSSQIRERFLNDLRSLLLLGNAITPRSIRAMSQIVDRPSRKKASSA